MERSTIADGQSRIIIAIRFMQRTSRPKTPARNTAAAFHTNERAVTAIPNGRAMLTKGATRQFPIRKYVGNVPKRNKPAGKVANCAETEATARFLKKRGILPEGFHIFPNTGDKKINPATAAYDNKNPASCNKPGSNSKRNKAETANERTLLPFLPRQSPKPTKENMQAALHAEGDKPVNNA